MKLIATVEDMHRYVRHNQRKNRKIGLVPTMGYFHAGHRMLIREARKRCDRLVVSIFVNPLQFGRGSDFATYPRNLRRDLVIARELEVNVVFAPSSDDLYPRGYSTFVEEERLSKKVCGRFRPGHFKGVTTVVAKLFNIVSPRVAVFGEKDAQQAVIIRKMVSELNYPIKIVVLPTVREKDGLACSSRNKYLTARQRREAPVIYRSLRKAAAAVRAGVQSSKKIESQIRQMLSDAPLLKVEYVEIADPETLEPVRQISRKTLVAVAVHIGRARLIDNICVEP